jgi:hypothetical protein
MAKDTNIKIADNDDNIKIINDLVILEKDKCKQFIGDNPEILLPANLDLDCEPLVEFLKGLD